MTVPPTRPLAGQHVLLVEDEFLIAMTIEAALREAGADVLGPAKSVAAARALLPQKPTLAVLDYRLVGGETSLPVAHDLLARDVPFLFHTGNATPTTLRAEFPGVTVLTKPCADRMVAEACAALLGPTPR